MTLTAHISISGLVYPLLEAGNQYHVREFVITPRGRLIAYKLKEVYGVFSYRCFIPLET
jgi:hypothetical protein